jgi:hypothetical protein
VAAAAAAIVLVVVVVGVKRLAVKRILQRETRSAISFHTTNKNKKTKTFSQRVCTPLRLRIHVASSQLLSLWSAQSVSSAASSQS